MRVRPGSGRAPVGMLRQPVADLVIVAAMRDEDVADGAQAGRRIEAAGGDRDDGAADAPPEQAGAALAAEAALGEAGGFVPAQPALRLEAQIGARRIGIGADMAVEAPALPTMAVHHVAQRAVDGEPHGTAFATA